MYVCVCALSVSEKVARSGILISCRVELGREILVGFEFLFVFYATKLKMQTILFCWFLQVFSIKFVLEDEEDRL